MRFAAAVLILVVAVLHLGFAAMEALFWRSAYVRRTFRLTEAFAAESRALAANQGLYNVFLAAGLLWALGWYGLGAHEGRAILTFFLGCVIVAAIFGAATVSRRILLVQGLPAVLALAALFLA